jgi:hypothetical protein
MGWKAFKVNSTAVAAPDGHRCERIYRKSYTMDEYRDPRYAACREWRLRYNPAFLAVSFLYPKIDHTAANPVMNEPLWAARFTSSDLHSSNNGHCLS